eukprot:scaffold2078_cov34-Tisochrysis_lutea.AAC.3
MGNVSDFQQRHITAFLPFISDTLSSLTTFGFSLSMLSLMTDMRTAVARPAGAMPSWRPEATAAEAQKSPSTRMLVGRRRMWLARSASG